MSVQTEQISWGLYKGYTKVRLRGGCTQELVLVFRTRHEAASFLQAMRKRVR